MKVKKSDVVIRPKSMPPNTRGDAQYRYVIHLKNVKSPVGQFVILDKKHTPGWSKGRYSYLEDVYIKRPFRRKGIGTQLYKTAPKLSKQEMRMFIMNDNLRAIKAATKSGWTPTQKMSKVTRYKYAPVRRVKK